MYLIIGGAYQGKMEYAAQHFGLSEEDICVCTDDREPDFSRRCLHHVERYVRFCLKKGADPAEKLEKWSVSHGDGVLICEDIFCGVVPTDKETRAWREAAGRCAAWAAGKAEGVVRLFCGLPQVLK